MLQSAWTASGVDCSAVWTHRPRVWGGRPSRTERGQGGQHPSRMRRWPACRSRLTSCWPKLQSGWPARRG